MARNAPYKEFPVGVKRDILGAIIGLVSSRGEYLGALSGTVMLPSARTSTAVYAAMLAVQAAGGGTVLLDPVAYDGDIDIPLVPGVEVIGPPLTLTLTGNVPDAGFTYSGGARFMLRPGVTGFYYNNVDRGSVITPLAPRACVGAGLRNIVFSGGLAAVDTGAYLDIGVVWSRFEMLIGLEQTGEAFNFENFQHCNFKNIYQSTTVNGNIGGVFFRNSLDATLYPGNSTIDGEIYTYTNTRKARSIVFESRGPSGGILNELKVSGRLQGNRYGPATPDTINMTTTSGNANISVPDASYFVVGMPFVFASTAPTGFTTRCVCFVISVNTGANTITIAESPSASATTPTSSSTYVATCSGFPSVDIRGAAGNAIKNSDFGLLDLEAYGNVCALVVNNVSGCKAHIAEIMTSYTTTAIVLRNAGIGVTYVDHVAATSDESGLHGNCAVKNLANGPLVYSGGSFTLDPSYNGKAVRYTGTSDITITIPLNLPKGFEMQVVPTGATGIITFAIASGGLLTSKNGFRTNGQYANVRLSNVANKVFALGGDTQV